MSKPLTIKQLLEECKKEIANGHGDYTIALSNDDEGNGYHYCWYAFTSISSDEAEYLYGIDNTVAPVEKTIILG